MIINTIHQINFNGIWDGPKRKRPQKPKKKTDPLQVHLPAQRAPLEISVRHYGEQTSETITDKINQLKAIDIVSEIEKAFVSNARSHIVRQTVLTRGNGKKSTKTTTLKPRLDKSNAIDINIKDIK